MSDEAKLTARQGETSVTAVTGPQRIVVTGGTGFIGASLVRQLEAEGHDVYPLARGPARLQGDLADASWLSSALAEVSPSVVFHLAAATVGREGSAGMEAALDSNVRGSLHLLRAAVAARCAVLVHASSAQVYGQGAPAPHREDAALRPASAYALAKAAVEMMGTLFSATTELAVISLRFPIVYGPGQQPTMMIPDLIGRAQRRERFQMSPGAQQRDYLYVDDAVAALQLASRATSARGEIVNIGSGRGVAVRTVVEKVLGQLGDPIKPELTLPYRPSEAMVSYLDIAKAEQQLGWRPAVSLDEGLRRTLAWYDGQR